MLLHISVDLKSHSMIDFAKVTWNCCCPRDEHSVSSNPGQSARIPVEYAVRSDPDKAWITRQTKAPDQQALYFIKVPKIGLDTFTSRAKS